MVRWVLAAALVLFPFVAEAANGLRPRTPAVFSGVPCVTTAEIGTVLHFEYSVPYDDIDLTPDELEDSRRMQFFALAHLPFDYAVPLFVSQEDLDRAEANGDNTREYGAQDVLETAAEWPTSQWVAITGDDPRVPITAAQAAKGVDWDTTGVSPGTWVVAAYTWEPENSLWSFRMGTVRLANPGDPDSGGPTGFFSMAPDAPPATVGEPYVFSACITAPPGSTYTASLGIIEGIDEPVWEAFVDDTVASNGDLKLELVPPPSAGGQSIKVRLDVTDVSGNTYVAYSPFPVLVFADSSDHGSDSDGADGEGGQDDGGGRCGVGGRPGPTLLVAGLLLFILCRREPSVRTWAVPSHAMGLSRR